MKVLHEALARRIDRLPPETSCYRWLDGELEGVTVDRFERLAVLSLYRDAPEEQALADALLTFEGVDAVYVKRRPREARRVANETPALLAPPAPIAGVPLAPFACVELGARFEIRPDNGLSVGLYLDARAARGWVQRHARGRRVLNTFAYTCGFGLAALRGGATRAVNLDASRKVLDWGARNYELNGLPVDRYDFISGDTFDWLGRFAKKGETFELVILDPPGFATTRHSRFSAQGDYHRLVSAAVPVVASGGLVLAMCNVEQSAHDFERQLQRGLGARRATVRERFGASELDFRQPSALRCVVLELA